MTVDIPADWLAQWPNRSTPGPTCGETDSGNFACCREKGHAVGPHVARTSDDNTQAYSVWWDAGPIPEWPFRESQGSKDCHVLHPEGWTCSRTPDHDGPHVAYYSDGERCPDVDPWGFPEIAAEPPKPKGRRATHDELVKLWNAGHFPTEVAEVGEGGCESRYTGPRFDAPGQEAKLFRCCRLLGHTGPHTSTGMGGKQLRAIWEDS